MSQVDESFAESLGSSQGQAELAAILTDYTVLNMPVEKLRLQFELEQTQRELAGLPSQHIEGVGQLKASIPPRAYFRWQHMYPGCWKDPAFEAEFLADNPACCANGYKPKAKTIYFDMGATSHLLPGARIYHALKQQVGLPDGMKPLAPLVI